MQSQQTHCVKQQKQRIVVITGGNAGIGYAVADDLYKKGQTIIFGARSVDKNQKAVQQITTKYESENKMFPGRSIVGFHLDLTNRASIAEFAGHVRKYLGQKFGSKCRIDILINNAAILGADNLELIEGIEKSVYVNYFGHFYLTYFLFPLLAQAQYPKIINLSSDVSLKIRQCQNNQQLSAGEYSQQNMWDLCCQHKKYDSFEQYAVSKLFDHMFSVELQTLFNQNNSEYKTQNIEEVLRMKTAAIHPGFVDTAFGDHNQLVQDIKKKYSNLMKTPEEGAKGIIALCQRDTFQWTDDYYGENGEKKVSNQIAHKADKTRQLWDFSEKHFGINFREAIMKNDNRI